MGLLFPSQSRKFYLPKVCFIYQSKKRAQFSWETSTMAAAHSTLYQELSGVFCYSRAQQDYHNAHFWT